MKLLILIIFIILGSAVEVTAQGWRGIVPLRSKRSDVERLLGQPRLACSCDASSRRICHCQYEAAEGLINIYYAPSACDGYPSGWNVPADTVLQVGITWKEPRDFSTLQLDVSQFAKAGDDTFTIYYASREKGVEYTVSSEEKLIKTSYIPTEKDSHLRCPCFPALDESTQRSTIFDQFTFRAVNDGVLGRIDTYLIALSNYDDNWKGYVLLYRGKHASTKTVLSQRRAIQKHLYQTRGLTPARIVILDGGYQEQPWIELFMFSPELAPPEPRATWKPCKQRSG